MNAKIFQKLKIMQIQPFQTTIQKSNAFLGGLHRRRRLGVLPRTLGAQLARQRAQNCRTRYSQVLSKSKVVSKVAMLSVEGSLGNSTCISKEDMSVFLTVTVPYFKEIKTNNEAILKNFCLSSRARFVAVLYRYRQGNLNILKRGSS